MKSINDTAINNAFVKDRTRLAQQPLRPDADLMGALRADSHSASQIGVSAGAKLSTLAKLVVVLIGMSVVGVALYFVDTRNEGPAIRTSAPQSRPNSVGRPIPTATAAHSENAVSNSAHAPKHASVISESSKSASKDSSNIPALLLPHGPPKTYVHPNATLTIDSKPLDSARVK